MLESHLEVPITISPTQHLLIFTKDRLFLLVEDHAKNKNSNG